MAVRIRMQRKGRKKRPFYRIVAADRSAPRDGRFIELLGTYDPLQNPPAIRVKRERVDHWIEHGATPSDTVANLLKLHAKIEAGVDVTSKKSAKQIRREKKQAEAAKRAEAEAKAKAEEEAKAEAEAKAAKAAAEADAAKAESEAAEAAEADTGDAEEDAKGEGDEAAPAAETEAADADAEGGDDSDDA